MDHILLAFVRRQDTRLMNRLSRLVVGLAALHLLACPPGSNIGFGVTQPCSQSKEHDNLQPHRGARTVRVVSVRQNVRVYTPDLVKTCCKLGYSTSQRGDSRLTCIRTISRLGVSSSTDAQADAAICSRFQEAHGPSS